MNAGAIVNTKHDSLGQPFTKTRRRMSKVARCIIGLCAGISILTATVGCGQSEPSLEYSPVVVEVGQGFEITTAPPEIEGRGIEYSTFSLESKSIEGIQIDADTGAVIVESSAPLGAYRLDVGALGKGGKAVYKDALVVFVLPALPTPQSITYTESPLSVVTGVRYISEPPEIDDLAGSLRFSLPDSPEPWLAIDETSGVLRISESAKPGAYKIPVTVSNDVGEVRIDSAVELTVRAFVTFNDDIKPLVEYRCAPCHTFGTGTENLTVYETAAKKPDKILTRIQLPSTDRRAMPPGGPQLSELDRSLFVRWRDEGLMKE